MSSLETQLATIFKKGIAADPKAAASLAASLSKHTSQDGVTKAEANYHTAYSTGKECGDCNNFNSPSSCEVVSGHVSADGTCDYWSGNSESSAEQSSDTVAESPAKDAGD